MKRIGHKRFLSLASGMKLGYSSQCFWHVSARWSAQILPWQTSMNLTLGFGSVPGWTVIRAECNEKADCKFLAKMCKQTDVICSYEFVRIVLLYERSPTGPQLTVSNS